MRDRSRLSLSSLGLGKDSFAAGPFGSSVSSKNFVDRGLPMIRGSNLSEDVSVRIDDANLVFLPQNFAEKFPRAVVREGDLVFTSWGTVGQVGIIDDRREYSEYLISNKQMRFSPDNRKALPVFLYYYLSQPDMVSYVRGQAIGSSVPGFNLGQLKELEISLPLVKEQLAIGEVLSALDDKIFANRKLAGVTGELQTVLWRQGSHGRPKVALTYVSTPLLGGTPKRSDESAWGGAVRWASVRDLTAAQGKVLLETAESISAEAAASARRLTPLPAGSIAVTARGTVGHVVTLGVPAAINQSAYAFVPPGGRGAILRLALESVVDQLRAHAHGSVFSTITMNTLDRAMVPDMFGADTERLARDLEVLEFRRITALKENQDLNATRDELLPLLMNGKITVKDAEKTVEDVV